MRSARLRDAGVGKGREGCSATRNSGVHFIPMHLAAVLFASRLAYAVIQRAGLAGDVHPAASRITRMASSAGPRRAGGAAGPRGTIATSTLRPAALPGQRHRAGSRWRAGGVTGPRASLSTALHTEIGRAASIAAYSLRLATVSCQRH